MTGKGKHSWTRYVRSVIGEDANKYQLDFEKDAETGEEYQAIWVPKADVDKQVVEVWEAQKASMQPDASSKRWPSPVMVNLFEERKKLFAAREESKQTASDKESPAPPVVTEPTLPLRERFHIHWLKVFNDLFKYTAHPSNPNSPADPDKYWNEAFDMCMDFNNAARRLGIKERVAASGEGTEKKWITNKPIWEVEYQENEFAAFRVLQVLVEVVVRQLQQQIQEETDDQVEVFSHGFKLVKKWVEAQKRAKEELGCWHVDQKSFQAYCEASRAME